MVPWLAIWCSQGVAFGVTYPDDAERIWIADYETPDQHRWGVARSASLNIPEEPVPLSLEEMKNIVLEEAREYARSYFPELEESVVTD